MPVCPTVHHDIVLVALAGNVGQVRLRPAGAKQQGGDGPPVFCDGIGGLFDAVENHHALFSPGAHESMVLTIFAKDGRAPGDRVVHPRQGAPIDIDPPLVGLRVDTHEENMIPFRADLNRRGDNVAGPSDHLRAGTRRKYPTECRCHEQAGCRISAGSHRLLSFQLRHGSRLL